MGVWKMQKRILFTCYIFLSVILMAACNNVNQSGKLHFSNDRDQGNTNVESEESKQDEESQFIVVIDPGHGGRDEGATSASGQEEKYFTLNLAEKVQNLLEQVSEIKVYMTRETDIFLSAEQGTRQAFANDLDADLYISIHGNTFSDPSVSGTESYYYHEDSKAFAETMHEYVTSATGFEDRGLRQEPYFVVKDTNMPAVLLEIGYLTNPANEQKMLSDDFQLKIAKAICDGVKDYLGLE